MSKRVLVMLMTEDWIAAKHKHARRQAMTLGVSSSGSQCASAWSIAHWK